MATTQNQGVVCVSSLRKDALNVVKVNEHLTVLVFYNGDDINVVQDICPHMGGPLLRGKFCSETRTLTCIWHGYKFCTTELTLKENPNEHIWIKPMAPEDFDSYKTPKYKLRKIRHKIQDGNLIIQE